MCWTQDIFFGQGNLADLLPDIDLAADSEQQQQQQAEGQEEGAGAAGALGGSLRGSGRLTPYSSSQFPLLEETEPDQATQLPGGQGQQLSTTTRVALR